MTDLLTIENLGNLLMLCFLQAVLGFDNLLYISIESQRAPAAQQAAVRRWGILIAVALRVVLLFVMIQLIDAMAEPFVTLDWTGVITGGVNFATCVFILGGIFIMYTAVKEIGHMLSIEHLDTDLANKSGKSAKKVVLMIVVMNLIFSLNQWDQRQMIWMMIWMILMRFASTCTTQTANKEETTRTESGLPRRVGRAKRV